MELAPAKVNLFLAVGRRRPDGYHDLLTLFETIPLWDTVSVTVRPGASENWVFHARTQPGAAVGAATGAMTDSVTVATEDKASGSLPQDLDNLAGRAAKLYVEELEAAARGGGSGKAGPAAPPPGEIDIRLDKRIPVAAGLGGGSSDAAAVLRALQRCFGYPLNLAALDRVAATLGSDVPFFLAGGRAAGRSRGEILSPLPAEPRLPLVLGLPSFPLPTPEVYREFDRRATGAGAGVDTARDQAGSGCSGLGGPSGGQEGLATLVAALGSGDLRAVAAALRDDLQPAALALRPEIGPALDALREAGCLEATMSGSGPAVFGLAPDQAEAQAIADRARAVLPAALGGKYTFVACLSGAPS